MGIRDWEGPEWFLCIGLTVILGGTGTLLGIAFHQDSQKSKENEQIMQQKEVQKKDDDKKEEQRLIGEQQKIENLVDKEIGVQNITVNIKDTQYRNFTYNQKNSDETGDFPILLIGTNDPTGDYVFIHTSADFVKKGSANIKYKKIKNKKIRVDDLIKLKKGQEYKHNADTTLNAKGIVEKISYDL
ncbi:hypothetical protein HOK51_04190 [Candidatus Woesearchaeota archaeon]|jgi:hypothetical protein|nr:hypothetical protein [Candidatus Woesearchaeota archaeon]MBT6519022.1 hypothetical protein [Candidatus Woesearchaeota archaeon]MBT7368779.1 hypothetical protein [Candidatus Woesearchaeota archaeon]